MFSQVTDFSAECIAFGELIDRTLSTQGAHQGTALFEQPTQFKSWTLNDILGHLHVWNWAADTSLHNPEHFQEFIALVMDAFKRGQMRRFEQQWLKGLEGEALLDTWRNYAAAMCNRFEQADPGTRVKWAGPDMSVRSSITARLMETWAHTQAVYDLLGVERKHYDRIKNIVVLGINTYDWTFKNRSLLPPEPAPFVSLRAPSGSQWEFNPPSDKEYIQGNAAEFCQVVTQVRNIKDTALQVCGDNATHWMHIAQCFAGTPEDPPVAGSRFKVSANG